MFVNVTVWSFELDLCVNACMSVFVNERQRLVLLTHT
jgi:hypothetical protein